MATAVVLLYTAPIFVVILARVLYGERLTIRKIISLILAITGCILVVGLYQPGNLLVNGLGILFGLGAGFTYALYNIMGKQVATNYSPLTIVVYLMGLGALFLFPLRPLSLLSVASSPPRAWLLLLVLAMVLKYGFDVGWAVAVWGPIHGVLYAIYVGYVAMTPARRAGLRQDVHSSLWLIALVTAVVCMILGMGMPTTAAYVLVAAVLAPALTRVGVAPIVAHMFVFYYATLSVITPPVCVAVFVAAGIAQTGWLSVAKEACKLGAVTYVIPFMFLVYPGMLATGTWLDFVEAIVSGVVFTLSFAMFFGGARFFDSRTLNAALLLAIAVLAALPTWYGLGVSAVTLALLWMTRRHRLPLPQTASGPGDA